MEMPRFLLLVLKWRRCIVKSMEEVDRKTRGRWQQLMVHHLAPSVGLYYLISSMKSLVMGYRMLARPSWPDIEFNTQLDIQVFNWYCPDKISTSSLNIVSVNDRCCCRGFHRRRSLALSWQSLPNPKSLDSTLNVHQMSYSISTRHEPIIVLNCD